MYMHLHTPPILDAVIFCLGGTGANKPPTEAPLSLCLGSSQTMCFMVKPGSFTPYETIKTPLLDSQHIGSRPFPSPHEVREGQLFFSSFRLYKHLFSKSERNIAMGALGTVPGRNFTASVCELAR